MVRIALANTLRFPPIILALLACAACSFMASPAFSQTLAPADELRLHQIQLIGTHNSYHIEPAAGLKNLIRAASVSLLQSIEYSHRPLTEQLSQLGVRQLELDIYADPKGGLFAKPLGRTLVLASGGDAGSDPNAAGILEQPGFKVLHAPGFDFATNSPTLENALKEIQTWSRSLPNHFPVMVLLELKEFAPGPSGVQPVAFSPELIRQLHELLEACVPREQCILPQDLCQPGDGCVRDAVLSRGWPRLKDVRGRLFFCLDNEGDWTSRWLQAMESVATPRVFVSVPPEHPQAAWLKRNDPEHQFEEIRNLVRQNFLIRTRADADTRQSRSGETHRREQAFASGAQYISTDFPIADSRYTDYSVTWQKPAVGRRNPVSLPTNITANDANNWLQEPR